MLVLIGTADAEVANFIATATGYPMSLPVRTIGFVNGAGRLVAGAAFTHYTGFGVEVSGAGRELMSRTARQAIGDFVFGALGCRRLSIHTPANHRVMKKLAPRLGFRFEGRARGYYGAGDALVYSMLAEDAIRLKHWEPRPTKEANHGTEAA